MEKKNNFIPGINYEKYENHLNQIKNAQYDNNCGYEKAISDLKNGRKRSCWIWYIFPQLAGITANPSDTQKNIV